MDGKSRVVPNGEKFYYKHLSHQMKTLWEYKKVAEQCNMRSDAEDCTAEAVEASIKKCSRATPHFGMGSMGHVGPHFHGATLSSKCV